MSTIVTRAGKGSPLTWNEVDNNFTNLNTDKLEAATTSTLTNKTINLTSNTLTGTTAQFNTALSDGDFATLAGTETLTNKTITSPTITGAALNGTLGATTPSTVAATTVKIGTTATSTAGSAIIINSTSNASSLQLGNNSGTGSNGGAILYGNSGNEFAIYSYIGAVGAETATRKFNISGSLTTSDQSLSVTGNLTASSLTSGRVTFAGTGGLLSDSANLVWDNSNARLGIGTASPAQKLDVAGTVRIVETGTPSGDAALQVSVNGTNARTIRMTDTGSSGKTFDFINRAQGIGGNFGFFDNTAGAYRYIIDSSGNLGLGVTPSAWGTYKGFDVNTYGGFGASTAAVGVFGNSYYNGSNYIYKTTGAASFYAGTGGSHQWFNAASGTAGNAITFTQAMTLDASGNLLVGKTSALDNTGVGLIFRGSIGNMTCTSDSATTAYNTYHLYNLNATNNGYRFYVNANGGISNYSGNNINLSDERTKHNIELSGSYIDKICAIPVKLFNYKDEADGEQKTLGVIAQDVEAVAPEFVNNDGWEGTAPEDGVPLKTIYTTDMMFGLMKCIQEQQAMIDELKAKVAALEAA